MATDNCEIYNSVPSRWLKPEFLILFKVFSCKVPSSKILLDADSIRLTAADYALSITRKSAVFRATKLKDYSYISWTRVMFF